MPRGQSSAGSERGFRRTDAARPLRHQSTSGGLQEFSLLTVKTSAEPLGVRELNLEMDL